jgi:hypothetical protein
MLSILLYYIWCATVVQRSCISQLLLLCLALGCVEDALNGLVERAVKLFVTHRVSEALHESTRKASSHTILPSKDFIGFLTSVSTRESDHTNNVGMFDAFLVKVVNGRECQLEHDLSILPKLVELLEKIRLEQRLGLHLFWRLDIDLRLEDWDESRGNDLFANLKLLINDGLDAFFIGEVDDRAHLGPKDTCLLGALEKAIQSSYWLHELHAILFFLQALVNLHGSKAHLVINMSRGSLVLVLLHTVLRTHLENRDDILDFPQVLARRQIIHLAIHCVLKENCGEDPIAFEGRARHDSRAHGMNGIKHGFFAPDVEVFGISVGIQGFRSRTTALVQGSHKAVGLADFLHLLVECGHDLGVMRLLLGIEDGDYCNENTANAPVSKHLAFYC